MMEDEDSFFDQDLGDYDLRLYEGDDDVGC